MITLKQGENYMIRDLVYFNNPILKTVCDDVDVENDDIKQDVIDMIDTMKRYKGCGLSASQIGITKRFAIIELEDGDILTIINPIIRNMSDKMINGKEGCLSYPKISKNIKRAEWIVIEYTDIHGFKIITLFEGLEARIIQHEMNHMDGRCLVGV